MHDRGETSLDAFKARLPLAEIVGRYVRLTRRGREHTGLCPFHQEKTPSFSVVEEKGFYHCFGCGAHGDAIGFIMEVEGLSFPDALAKIGEITGIEPPRRSGDNAPKIDPGLAEANAAAMRWFEDQLRQPRGRSARQYLERRGVGEEAVARFHIGYAPPQRSGLKDWLAANGIGEKLAIEAGLLIAPEDGGASYDRFRERLIFPIEDHRGRIVAFGGRALADQRAKYLNSPETPLFHKGSVLFGLPLASKAAKKAQRILLVEGYMDVVALADAGIGEAVAPLGTAVTEDQLRLLWRYADEPVVCLDGDEAGFAAALRATRRALPIMRGGQSLRFALLPEGDDPDSFVRKHGREAMENICRSAMPLSRLIWQAEHARQPVDTAEKLAGLRKRLSDYSRLAEDADLRRYLHDQFRSLADARWAAIAPKSGNWRGSRRNTRQGQRSGGAARWERSPELGATSQRTDSIRDLRLVAYFILFPDLLARHDELFADLELRDPRIDALRQQILVWFASDENLDPESLRHHLTCHGYDQVVEMVMKSMGPVSRDSGVDRQAVDRLLESMRHGAALKRESVQHEAAIRERRERELDAHRLSQNELLNESSTTVAPGGHLDAD